LFNILKVCGQNIRQYRKKKNLTIRQLSQRLGITGAYLGYLERGQRNASLITLAKIAETLEIPPYMLLQDPEDEFEKAVRGLLDLLIDLNDTKHIVFLKEVLDAYVKLKDT